MMEYNWLNSHAKNWYSQFGEDGVIEAIFSKISAENRWCFECGAADGIFFSNTRRLIEQGWNSIQVEADPRLFQQLKFNSEKFGSKVMCIQAELGMDQRLDTILEFCSAPTDIDFVVIDVDGQDYHIFNSILKYRPRVIQVEFNALADPDYVPAIGDKGQAGWKAIKRLAKGRFYQ